MFLNSVALGDADFEGIPFRNFEMYNRMEYYVLKFYIMTFICYD